MVRQYFLWLFFSVLVVSGLFYWESRETAFARAFDNNLARYALAASIAARDPGLREVFLRQTEAAFNKAGWRAANGALKLALAMEVEVYADDSHLNNLRRAELMLLRKLQEDPPACKAFLLAGAEEGEFVPAATREYEQVKLASRAAIENGFDRKMRGEFWMPPSDQETLDLYGALGRGPIAALTSDEQSAESKYLDADSRLYCSAAIKRRENLAALDDHDAAQDSRVLLTTLANIDIAEVLTKLCREKDNNIACP
jgi:hypothetical protein